MPRGCGEHSLRLATPVHLLTRSKHLFYVFNIIAVPVLFTYSVAQIEKVFMLCIQCYISSYPVHVLTSKNTESVYFMYLVLYLLVTILFTYA